MLMAYMDSHKFNCCRRYELSGVPADERACLGSRCAAWHWHDFYLEEGKPASAVRRRYGYCGLAGAPTRVDVEIAREHCRAMRKARGDAA